MSAPILCPAWRATLDAVSASGRPFSAIERAAASEWLSCAVGEAFASLRRGAPFSTPDAERLSAEGEDSPGRLLWGAGCAFAHAVRERGRPGSTVTLLDARRRLDEIETLACERWGGVEEQA